MSVEDKKMERSKAKMAVTVASRHLIGAVNRESEYNILKNLMIDLEKAYDDFCNVNEEFEIIVCEEKYAEHCLVNDRHKNLQGRCLQYLSRCKEIMFMRKERTKRI